MSPTMIINVRDIAKQLHITIPDLITRGTGSAVYRIIHAYLPGIPDQEALVLDFTDIKVIDTSFIDECIVRLVYDSRTHRPVFFVKVAAVSAIAEMNIESVFTSHARYGGTSFAVVIDRQAENNSYYLGSLSPPEHDIINYLYINKSAHVNEVADFIAQPIRATTDILDTLHAMRLIRRSDQQGVTLYTPL
jgi:hypothetical protein